jgi:hypothetical protein
MGSLSNYVEDEVLDHVLKTGDWAQPAALYVALSTADPTDDASGILEPVGNGYARVSHAAWDVAASRATENTGTISFPEASGAWGTITHFFISDASTAGNMIAHGALSASKTIGAGDNASFQDGAIDVSFNTGGIATFLANAVLDHIFGNTAYDTTATIYVALSLANPTDDGSAVDEHSGDAYARVAHNTWDVSSGGATENDGAITFPQASAAWGTVTHFAMFDAATAGNMLFYGSLDNARNIGQNDTPSFADGALDITMD